MLAWGLVTCGAKGAAVEAYSIVTAYHGTTREVVDRILHEGFLKTELADAWLGHGVYFFQAAPLMALAYARREARKRSGTPTVLYSRIALRNCFDLFDIKWSRELQSTWQNLKNNNTLPPQKGLKLKLANGIKIDLSTYDSTNTEDLQNNSDCAIVNKTLRRLETGEVIFSSVRAPFVFGRQVYDNSYFFHQTHVQISVRDQSIILDRPVEMDIRSLTARLDTSQGR